MDPRVTDFIDPSGLSPDKLSPALISADLQRFQQIAATVEARLEGLRAQRRAALADDSRTGRAASDRDSQVRGLNGRIRVLETFGPQVCLGRMDPADGSELVYVGRIGLSDDADRRLLLDWRTPAARPFFAATAADPMGLRTRRRFRWRDGRVADYWDEVLTADSSSDPAAMDAESAFIASLAASRSPRMPDVLATIQSDQDAAIRADARRPLIVEGGPGTGKTVVALHRAAYLIYADPRLDGRGGGVLLIGPHPAYLAYTADVLPDLGESGVQVATLADLVPEGAAASAEDDPVAARLKADARMAETVEPAVALYEEPPIVALAVDTDWGEVEITAADWARAFESVGSDVPHNEARDEVWHELVEAAVEDCDLDAAAEALSAALYADEELRTRFSRAWPVLDAEDLVADLWEVPAYLRRCAPWLSAEEARHLRRADPRAWTVADLPLLDAMRRRLGDRRAGSRARRRERVLADQRAYMDDVVAHILDADDDPDSSLAMLRGTDLRQVLLDVDALPSEAGRPLDGPFSHVIVDEAQELTDAQWQMILRRCPSHSLTIVGDRAQAREGFAESWEARLARVGLHDVTRIGLSVNYRTPGEVMEAAEPVIYAQLPDAVVPTSVRTAGIPVRRGSAADLRSVVDEWLGAHPQGVGCVIGAPGFDGGPRVRALSPVEVKGLEFDLVVLVHPERFGDGLSGAVDRYVAMTRATSELVILV